MDNDTYADFDRLLKFLGKADLKQKLKDLQDLFEKLYSDLEEKGQWERYDIDWDLGALEEKTKSLYETVQNMLDIWWQ